MSTAFKKYIVLKPATGNEKGKYYTDFKTYEEAKAYIENSEETGLEILRPEQYKTVTIDAGN